MERKTRDKQNALQDGAKNRPTLKRPAIRSDTVTMPAALIKDETQDSSIFGGSIFSIVD